MTIKVRAFIGTGHTSWIFGDGRVIHPALRAARSPRQYDTKRRAIAVPTRFLDDVLAALEMQSGVDVEVEREQL